MKFQEPFQLVTSYNVIRTKEFEFNYQLTDILKFEEKVPVFSEQKTVTTNCTQLEVPLLMNRFMIFFWNSLTITLEAISVFVVC